MSKSLTTEQEEDVVKKPLLSSYLFLSPHLSLSDYRIVTSDFRKSGT